MTDKNVKEALDKLRDYARSTDDNIPYHHYDKIDELVKTIENHLTPTAPSEPVGSTGEAYLETNDSGFVYLVINEKRVAGLYGNLEEKHKIGNQIIAALQLYVSKNAENDTQTVLTTQNDNQIGEALDRLLRADSERKLHEYVPYIYIKDIETIKAALTHPKGWRTDDIVKFAEFVQVLCQPKTNPEKQVQEIWEFCQETIKTAPSRPKVDVHELVIAASDAFECDIADTATDQALYIAFQWLSDQGYLQAQVDDEKLKTLKQLTETQCSKGIYDFDPYMQGMANGMILAVSIFEDKEPEYLEAPNTWLNKPQPDQSAVRDETFVLNRHTRRGFFTDTNTIICGSEQLENYMRQGYVVAWDATDRARQNAPIKAGGHDE